MQCAVALRTLRRNRDDVSVSEATFAQTGRRCQSFAQLFVSFFYCLQYPLRAIHCDVFYPL